MSADTGTDTAGTLGLVQQQLRQAETDRDRLIAWRRELARRAHTEGMSDVAIGYELGVTRAMARRLRAEPT